MEKRKKFKCLFWQIDNWIKIQKKSKSFQQIKLILFALHIQTPREHREKKIEEKQIHPSSSQ